MITIYYYCLDIDMTAVDEPFVADELNELAQLLRKKPIKLPVTIKALRDEHILAKKVNAILHKFTNPLYTFSNCVRETFELFVRLSVFDKTCPAQLLIYCPPNNSPIANAARKENPKAEWGATAPIGGFITHEYKSRIDSEDLSFMRENFLCAVYKPNSKVTVWHEALHLLGADDCYIVEDNHVRKKPCCNLDGCIMEYGAPENTCEKRPFLCERNVKKLKELAKKVE
jgi:hypothetical protein